jgi:hypothetical protein
LVLIRIQVIGKGENDDRLEAFFNKTKIDPNKAVAIVDKLEKAFPSSNAKYQSVKLVISGKEQKVVTLSKDRYLPFVSLNAQLKKQTKVPPKEELQGYLGAVVVWDQESPRFTIKTDDKKRPTIYYVHSDKNDGKIRDSIGKPVKVRVHPEAGKLYLVEWL